MDEINGYKLHKDWFNFVLSNPEKVTPSHTALYLWIVEINNRTSWRKKFAITSRECMDGMACTSRTTYAKCLKDLIEWEFIFMVQKSNNQHIANVISLHKICTSDVQASEQPSEQPSEQAVFNQVDYSKISKIEETTKPSKQVDTKEFNKNNFRDSLLEKGGDPQHVEDWLKVRASKKAPFTLTALNGFYNECSANNFPVRDAIKICAEEGWSGFKYTYVSNLRSNSGKRPQTNLTTKLESKTYDW